MAVVYDFSIKMYCFGSMIMTNSPLGLLDVNSNNNQIIKDNNNSSKGNNYTGK